ncbi:hypothetical protein, partial [Pseudonocardia abyssalis]
MDDRTTGDSPHEILLALAGRIDDDLLAWCRELVAVGEDGRALELIAGTLVADGTALPPGDRAAVVAAARAARTDLDVDAVLPPAAAEAVTAHRFDAGHGIENLAAAVGALPERLVAGCRTWVTFRTTPAGSAPGPLPQPVVLVEVAADDQRPVDVLGYQLAIACARVGAPAAVEVVVAGSVRPGYQLAALASALPVHGADEESASLDTDTFAVQTPAPPSPDSEVETPAAGIPESPAGSAWPSLGSLVMPPSARAFRSPEPDTADAAPLDRRSRREARESEDARAAGSWDFGAASADRITPAGGTPAVRPFVDEGVGGSALFGRDRSDVDGSDDDRAEGSRADDDRADDDRADEHRSDLSRTDPYPSTADRGHGADVDRADVDRADVDRADVDRADVDRADVDRTDVGGADPDRADSDRADPVRPDDHRSVGDPVDAGRRGPGISDTGFLAPERSGIDLSDDEGSAPGPPAAGRPDLDRPDLDRTDVDRTDVDRTDVDRTDVDRTDVDRTDVDRTDVDRTDVDRTDVDRTDVDRTDVDRTEDGRTDVDRTEDDGPGPSGAAPGLFGVDRADPGPGTDRGAQPLSGWPAIARSRSAAFAAGSFGTADDDA